MSPLPFCISSPAPQIVDAMNARLSGFFISAPWMVKLLMVNMETGVEGEPPQAVWDRTADALKLTHSQVRPPSMLLRLGVR